MTITTVYTKNLTDPGTWAGPFTGLVETVETGLELPVLAGAYVGWKLGRAVKNHRNGQGKFRRALGGKKGDGCEAHHIVAASDRRAAVSRKILKENDIGINDPRNGVLITRAGHQSLRTNAYHQRVERALSRNRNEADFALAKLQGQIYAQYGCGR